MKNLILSVLCFVGVVVVYNKFYKSNTIPTNPTPQETELAALPELKKVKNFSGIPIPDGINNAVAEKKSTRIATAPNTATTTKNTTVAKKTVPVELEKFGGETTAEKKEFVKKESAVSKKKVTEKKEKKTLSTQKYEPVLFVNAKAPNQEERTDGFLGLQGEYKPPKKELIFLGREKNTSEVVKALDLGRKEVYQKQ